MREVLVSLTLALAGALVFLSAVGQGATGDAVNFRNVSVDTTVNITNSFPEVTDIRLNDPVTLEAGTTKLVECNVTVRDFDGQNDIDNVNATFFDPDNTSLNAPNDNNNHYENASCTKTSGSGNVANYTCGFNVEYYANNATWNCTSFAEDTQNATGNLSNSTTVESLLALNVTQLIDYGDIPVGNISSSQEANVTNFGNVNINVSVRGYGNQSGDGLAMVCEEGNISVENERFDLNSSAAFNEMTKLNDTKKIISNFTVDRRVNDSIINNTRNGTYWKLRVPSSSNPSGVCNGTVVFQAESP